jgi:tetratricopeptide (TPR) repeat protein
MLAAESEQGMPDMTEAHKHLIYRLGFIVLLVLAVYGNTLNHGFVWDDNDIIVNNPLLDNLGNIPKFFLSEDKVATATGYYRPMTYVSFALDRAIWGANPVGFNITNLVLHILVALLFYSVIEALFKKEQLAFVAAVIFALHPIAGETVNFHAGGRNTLLSACFALLSLYYYIQGKHLPGAACFTLAIFSKEFALLLPMVFLMYDYRLQRKKISFSSYIPYLIPVVCYLSLRSFAVQKANFLDNIHLSGQLWMAPYLAARYLLNMIFPFQLKVMYDESTTIYVCILSLLVVALLVGALFLIKKHDELVFSDFWFLLFLLPVVNIIPIPANSLMADRYAYFSLMGFALGLAAFLCKAGKRGATAMVVILCAIYSFYDIRQNSVWKDDGTLFTRMANDAPEMFIGYRNLGLYYYNRGDLVKAGHYLAAACSKPDIPAPYLVGAASIFMEANKPEKAEELLLKALKLEPANPEPYLLLNKIYEQKGNKELADSYMVRAREAIPGFETELGKMAEDFCREGEKFIAERKRAQAANILRRALLVKPDYVPALVAMGHLCYEQGDFANARRHFEKVISLDPSNKAAHDYLPLLHQEQGRPAEVQR